MKKIKMMLVVLVSIFIFISSAKAASGSLSASMTNVKVGDTFTIYATINNASTWDIHVSATGPVSGCTINQVYDSTDNVNKTFSTTCKATGEGTIRIRLTGSVAAYEDLDDTTLLETKTVKVEKKETPQTNPPATKPIPKPAPQKPTPTPQPSAPAKSTNNKLKALSVDGYSLTKKNDTRYELTVSNTVTNINIKATAEDSKATILGTGNKELKVGENTFNIVITSESGAKNTITLKITRKDGYYIEDLDVLLNSNITEINIKINSNTKISSKYLEKIRSTKKIVNFNYYSDKKLVYSWIVDENKIDNIADLLTTITHDPESKQQIQRQVNNIDSVIIGLKQTEALPTGLMIKMYVGDKYKNGDLLYLYEYSNNKLVQITNNLKVEDGYITFSPTSSHDYLLTKTPIVNNINKKSNSLLPSFLIILLGAIGIFIIVIIILLIRKKKKKAKLIQVNNESINYSQPIVETQPQPLNNLPIPEGTYSGPQQGTNNTVINNQNNDILN